MELKLHGFLDKDFDDVIGLKPNKDDADYLVESIPDSIQSKFGYMRVDSGLGQKVSYIPNVGVYIFYADKECTLEEVQTEYFSKYLLGGSSTFGELKLQLDYVGYSEWTITGLDLRNFTVGGHDIAQELSSHIGDFCWIVFKTNLND